MEGGLEQEGCGGQAGMAGARSRVHSSNVLLLSFT